ncbi:hypothetical protein [Limnohabitans sp.]
MASDGTAKTPSNTRPSVSMRNKDATFTTLGLVPVDGGLGWDVPD